MKKYMAPEMETLFFAAEDAIAASPNSRQVIDVEFGEW